MTLPIARNRPTTPVTPETAIEEGYGNAFVLSRMSIELVLAKVRTSGNVKVKLANPRLLGPSWSWSTAVTVPAFVPLAVKLKGRLTIGKPPGCKGP